MEQEFERKVAPTRDHREIPPFNDIKYDLGIPEDARFIGWYINNPKNPLHFFNNTVNLNTQITKKLISGGVEKGKNFKLGEYQKALDFVDALPFAATVTVIFGYVKQSEEIPADTLNRAFVDAKATEYLMFSALALYDNNKPQFFEDENDFSTS